MFWDRVPLLVVLLIASPVFAISPVPGTQCLGRTADSDNDFATATAVMNNTPVAGNVNTADDANDYYKLSGVAAGQTIRVIASCASPRNISVTVYTEMNTSIRSSQGQKPTCIALAPANGTYYIRVRAQSGQSDYTLTVTIGYPEILTPGFVVSASLSNITDDWNCWYRIWLNGNVSGHSEGVFVNLSIANGGAMFSVYSCDILNFNGTRIYNETWSAFFATPMGFAATATGWYYYQINSILGASTYTLTTTRTDVPCDGDSDIENCTKARHRGVYDDRRIDKAWDHYDWYSYRVRAGDSFTVRADQMDTDHLFNMTIYNSSLGYIAGSTNQAGMSTVPYISLSVPSVPANDTYIICLSPLLWVKNLPSYSVSDQNAFLRYKLTFTSSDHPPRVLLPVDEITMTEDTTRDIDTAGHFEGIDETNLTFTGSAAHINTSFNSSTGKLTLTPRPDWSGHETLNIAVRDSWSTTTVPVNVTVLSANDPPYLKKPISNISIAQGGVDVSVDLNQIFADNDLPYGDRLGYTVSGNGSLNVTIAGNGRVNITAPPSFVGNVALIFAATDNASASVSATCNVSVYHVNQPPFVKSAPGNISMSEDEKYTLDLAGVFEDPDGDPLTLSAAGNQRLTVVLDPLAMNANISAPLNDAGFSEDVTFTGKDDKGAGDASVTVRVTVVPVNDAPRITNASPKGDAVLNEGDSLQFNVTASDVETPTAGLNFTWYIDGEAVSATGPSTVYSSNYTSAGNHTVKSVVCDGELNATCTWNITVRNVNRYPGDIRIGSPAPNQKFRTGTAVTLTGSASDPDGDELDFTWLDGTKELGTGSNLTVPGLAAGTYSIILQVSDGNATVRSRAVSFVITANVPPKIASTTPPQNQRFPAGKMISFSVIASDDEGDILTFSWTMEGQISPLSNQSAFSMSSLPAGTNRITVSVSDGRDCMNQTITFVVYTPRSDSRPDITGVLPLAVAGSAIGVITGFLILRQMKRRRPQSPAGLPVQPPASPGTNDVPHQ